MEGSQMELSTLLLEMAYTRSGYKNELESHLIGVILHYYKTEYAKANGQHKWVRHWTVEYKQMLGVFKKQLLHTVKGLRSRRKAALEVVEIIKHEDNNYRRAAQNEVNRDFKQKFRIPISDTTTEQIHQIILDSIDSILPE
jgi:hypothetical protein